MTSKLAPYLSQIPIGSVNQRGDVLASTDLIRWLETIIKRIGGSDAQTNIELATALSNLASGDMVMQPAQFEAIFADLMQPMTGDAAFPDVMQTPDTCCLPETTFQG